ncbi:MAG TPA: hypothetical protein VK994_08270, partial [Bacteroidales bacterium]|nr:hypothetical protein [Bacteroidales bacterium]
MKDFLKYMFASMLGVIIVIAIVFFISFGIVMGLMSYVEQQEVALKDNTVIRVDFKERIPERTPKSGIFSEIATGSLKRVLGLNDV